MAPPPPPTTTPVGQNIVANAGFESGVMQSEIDLLYTDVLEGHVDGAANAWPAAERAVPNGAFRRTIVKFRNAANVTQRR